MNRIKQWLNSFSGQMATEAQRNDITAKELRRMLRQCPICGAGFENHYYVVFAVTALDEENRGQIMEFFEACNDHLWEKAQMFQDFDPDRDAIVAYALRCQTGALALVTERSPFEFNELDRLITCETLDDASGRRLGRIIAKSSWRRMSWT